jgi:hypothetical protein
MELMYENRIIPPPYSSHNDFASLASFWQTFGGSHDGVVERVIDGGASAGYVDGRTMWMFKEGRYDSRSMSSPGSKVTGRGFAGATRRSKVAQYGFAASMTSSG